MNFPFGPHSKAKLAIDLHLFVYYGRLLHAKIGRCRDGCPYLNADWFCASCGQPRQNQGWWERGGGWLSEVAVMHPGSRCTWAVEQGSALGWCFSLVSLAWHYPQPQFLPSVEKEVDTKRKDIPFIRLEGPEAINTGRVEWWAEAKAVQRLWYYMRKQKKGKSSYCDPVREQQPFWLLFSLRGF